MTPKYLKRSILIICVIVALNIVIIGTLILTSEMPNSKKNGFERNISHSALLLNKLKIDIPLQKLCGATKSHLFFSVPNPQWLIMIDMSLQRIRTIPYPIPYRDEIVTAHNTVVDSPKIYFYATNTRSVYSGEINGNVVDSVRLNTMLFTRSVHVSSKLAFFRAFDSSLRCQRFEKINTKTGKIEKVYRDKDEKDDAGFSTDGDLVYDSENSNLIYVHYYSNKFYYIDTNLNILYKARTIDTTNNAKFETRTTLEDGKTKIKASNARVAVNIESCISNSQLYVRSGLIADNEDRDTFLKNSVIDVYGITDAKYQGSFYVPKTSGQKVNQISIINDIIVAIHENYLYIYRLIEL